MKRNLIAVLVFLAAPLAATAQTQIVPAAPLTALDAPRTQVRNALIVLRDSLITVNGAIARLQRDYREQSGITLVARARVIAGNCDRSARSVAPVRAAVLYATPTTPLRARQRTMFVGALDSLATSLGRCAREFQAMAVPGKGEVVRGYGNRRAEPVLDALGKYDDEVASYLAAWEIEIRPLGARRSPLEG